MSVSRDNLISRRGFFNLTAGGLAAATLLAASPLTFAAEETRIKAIAFDGFPIFDPRPVFALVNSLYPEKGVALGNSWRTAQFEYTWLRTIGGRYKNFWEVTESALVFAAKKNGVDLTDDHKDTLMQAYLHLNVWPDVLPALKLLKEKGIRLCLLSNMTPEMLKSGIKNAGLGGYFESVLSTDGVKEYKPSPKAYQMGIDSLRLKKEEIAFAAYAGWDAAGAKWFGYPTFWVNRQNNPMDELSITPDGVGADLNDLANFINVR